MIGLLALSKSVAMAQSTNLVQRANFVLRGTTQTPSGVKSVRLVNKDIFAALNETGEFNFGPNATLLFVNSEEQTPAIIIREKNGQQTTDTDVGAYFDVMEIGDGVHSSNDNKRWETWSFTFNNGTTNETAFQLWGATTIDLRASHRSGSGTLGDSQRVLSDVRGVGRVEGTITIFSGTVSSAHATLVTD